MIVDEFEIQGHECVEFPLSSRRVRLFVSSVHPVNLYVVDSANLRHYKSREPFVHHGPGAVRFYSQILHLPDGKWHALLENPLDAALRVQAKVEPVEGEAKAG